MRGTPLRPAALQPCRNSSIGSEAAREVAEHARAFYEHKVCGRKTMGNSVYVGTTGMLKASYINCTTIYEVRDSVGRVIAAPPYTGVVEEMKTFQRRNYGYINCTTIYEVRARPDCIAMLPSQPLLCSAQGELHQLHHHL